MLTESIFDKMANTIESRSHNMRTLPICLFVLFFGSVTHAATYEEKDGVVVIEAENTRSTPGKWQGKTDIKGFTGKGYIQFTGNKPTSGPPTSPLEYVFKINKSGLYYLHMHASREDHGQRKDYSNDCYVRVEGDFGAGPKEGNKHGNDAPLAALKKDMKFYGGTPSKFSWFSGNHLDLGGHNNKRVAVYNFKAGQRYKLVVSGRSQHFCIDRIMLRHSEVDKKRAEDLKLEETVAKK